MTKRFGLAGAVGSALVMLIATVVLAHAPLDSSDPADGATIKTPYTLTATFAEEITPNGSSIVVQSAGGTQVASGSVSTTDSNQMTVDLPVLPDGQYTVLWVSVTADDNGILRGTYHFNVSATGSSSSAAPVETPAPTASADSSTSPGALVAVAVAVVISLAVVLFVLYRNRR
ncbi:MAG TPA: copper resistance CopC family protein [Candidatus Limnocylindrales bacterium]|jgi:hypothetical protein